MASEAFKMEESDKDIFYEWLTPPQTPSPTITKTLHLPLSTLSIYCRQHSSANYSNKASTVLQNGIDKILTASADNDHLSSQKNATTLSSVLEPSSSGHLTFSEAAAPPTTPPSTHPSSYTLLWNPNDNCENGGCIESSPPSEVPPLSPSSSVSTTQTISEPPTPGKDGSIRPRRFWTSPTSPPSPHTSTSNEINTRTSSETNLQHRDVTSQQTPATPTPKPKSSRRKHSHASRKPAKTTGLIRRHIVPSIVPESGPFIPEGFHIISWPEAHSVIEPDTFESGHIIGYGKYPVPLTAQQLFREKRNIMRRKVRHYGVDDEIKIVRSSGSVSGESEMSSEGDNDSKKDDGEVVVWKERDTDANTVVDVESIGRGLFPTREEK
ncbi:hypothetical protein BKA64DRAFT_634043 [Cadophora sp. MPI-SDFR-AT-0126]|nr:hypothetical protein BKA64DRAFT_634043 [Leotiomycetes sp. MPI-SDFR-AT-0126]